MNLELRNACSGELSSYRKKDGKLSYSRLCCTNCKGHPEDNSKRFVDRDLNAALNILLAGTSVERPPVFAGQSDLWKENPMGAQTDQTKGLEIAQQTDHSLMRVDHLVTHITQTETGLVKCFLLKTEK